MALRSLLPSTASTQVSPRLLVSISTSPFSSVLERWNRLSAQTAHEAGSSLLSRALAGGFSSALSHIWDSVLRAVPKKKTSHMKKRHRQMAGKALKDVRNLTRCPGCGMIKRSHVLCSHCVKDIKEQWRALKE